MDTGELPLEWKSAYVTPVFTKDKRSDPSNYQPVSLTVLCKTFEHILVSQIMNHLETHQNNINIVSQPIWIQNKTHNYSSPYTTFPIT